MCHNRIWTWSSISESLIEGLSRVKVSIISNNLLDSWTLLVRNMEKYDIMKKCGLNIGPNRQKKKMAY